ncbi:glycosyltransferase family 4 protein [Aeromonas cavernicola]|uniref:Glycosyltransferase family 1 protein n=1 Tax=Aeromonas cavernicola TaxID=1006623 RepID=A0A2H9U805_9GAMM|nr:glycosyltransferase family 4 protein [Aeromonas cavernicola]PJG60141.1 glycosyltransferase family 1 protein [Aeromonas cavernicola]
MSITPVLLVHYGDDWIRGSERCLLDLLAHLDRRRFAPLLWCNSPLLAEEAVRLGVMVLVEPFSLLLGWQAPRFDLVAHRQRCLRARQLLREHQIAVVHANSAAPCQWLADVCQGLQVPLVCHLHARYQPRDRFSLQVHKANVLIGVSQPVLAPWYQDGCDPERLIHVANGVDPVRLDQGEPWLVREQLGLSPASFVLATIGSLIPRKGMDLLLRSLAELLRSGQDAHLLVIGSGPERNALEALAGELGVLQQVHFLGERADSAAILRGGVDLLVSGAREEVFGLTLAEAGMLGLPVSAYRVGGIPEVVDDGVTGLLAEPQDWVQMTHQWQRLADPQLRQQMGLAGQLRARQYFTVSRYTEKVMSIWSNLYAGQWAQAGRQPYGAIAAWIWQRLLAIGRAYLIRLRAGKQPTGSANMANKEQP